MTPERENRWQTRTSGDYIDYRSDSITRNQNIIRLPVTSTIVKETSTYVPLPPQTTTVTHTTLPITTTVSSVPMQIGIGQSINITSSKNNIPASYVVGPATISSNGPRELQGSFGSLPSPTLNLSSVRQEEVTNSMFRQGSASNLNPHLNSYPMESISKS